MTEDGPDVAGIDVSDAVSLYLRHYPARNDAEFDAYYGADIAAPARRIVRGLLDEAMRMQPDWNRLSLREAGDFVESEMRVRHPELSAEALRCIGNYYTYLMR